VHEQYAERSRKPRWGDQTAEVGRFADQIVAEDPRARFLHLVRDPRDRFVAILERGPRRPGAVGHATAAWLASTSVALRNRRRHAGRYLILRYEDLVSRPEWTMREVCAFLGEEYEPAMLRIDGVRRYDALRAASESGSPVSTAFVGRYRGSLSRADVAFIQSIAGQRMIAFDYRPDPIRLTPGERFRYAGRWPANRARMRSPA
jgi:Sulfotransferase family